MLLLLTIFLLLFIPIAMLVLHLARPKFSIQGLLAVLAVLVGWLLVILARQDIPQTITLLSWQPAAFFPNIPSLLIDDVSWYFSLALLSLALSSIVTSIAHLGRSLKTDPNQSNNKIEVIEIQEQLEKVPSSSKPAPVKENKSIANWQSWAFTLVLTSMGLVAVAAGNILTLLLAWAALDLIELFILLFQVLQSKSRERIILIFSMRMAGIGMILLAGILQWSQGMLLNFKDINQSIMIYLLLAACLRVGTLAVQYPLDHRRMRTHELETIFQLIPAAACYILFVRIANFGILGKASPLLLGLIALAGMYAGFNWLIADDELKGRSYWLLGTASLIITSAILNRPYASIAWSIASLLTGGLIFSMSMRHKNLLPIVLLGFFGFSALPFSPTWLGTDVYLYNGSPSNTITPSLFYLLSFVFLLTHSLFLAGFIRHILRGIIPFEGKSEVHIERWVWFLYPVGLFFIILTHFLIGILLFPSLSEIPFTGWIMGAVAVSISGIIWYFATRYIQSFNLRKQAINTSDINKFLSLERLYRFLGKLFHTLTRLAALISTILEGDGGILWAVVLFALIFVFLLR
jgi:hypothetical protein